MQEPVGYNVLISWSGDRSKAIAAMLKDWLSTVVAVCRPFMSDLDIGVGQRWQAEIARHLATIKVGVFVLTPENQNKPWVNFEAGAISREVGEGLAMGVLVGMEHSELSGPLTQFQNVVFEKSDMMKLAHDINRALGNQSIEEVVTKVFGYSWQALENDVRSVPIPSEALMLPTRTDSDLLREALQIIRDMSSIMYEQKGEVEQLVRMAKALPIPSTIGIAEKSFRFPDGSIISRVAIESAIRNSYSIKAMASMLKVDEEALKAVLDRYFWGWQDFTSDVPF